MVFLSEHLFMQTYKKKSRFLFGSHAHTTGLEYDFPYGDIEVDIIDSSEYLRHVF